MADEGEQRSSSTVETRVKDPRIKARKYQLELCQKAVEENVIVYLGTGCGKTHIAVLLMYELGHLIRKPQKSVCVFLVPTVMLVRQQADYVEASTDFKVGSYSGHESKRLRSHKDWEKEIEEHEVLVMTPQILLRNLTHRFIRMELIALLIFDECHHAQVKSNHPYSQIMKDFYTNSNAQRPRIFGMTASPIVGKGGSDPENLPKWINSLENLLDAKVCSVEANKELEKFVASPEVNIYLYDPAACGDLNYGKLYHEKLDEIKDQCMLMLRKKTDNLSILRNSKKMFQRLQEHLIFCLENLGLWGVSQAVRILLSGDQSERILMMETDDSCSDYSVADHYLTQASKVFDSNCTKDVIQSDWSTLAAPMGSIFSHKLFVLIRILATCRVKPDMKCIVFVSRIVVARALSVILASLKCLEFWKCNFLVGCHSGLQNMSRNTMNAIVKKFLTGELNLLVATRVGEEGLDIPTCSLVIRFNLPETVASFIQSRGRARMPESKYAFLVDRTNRNELDMIKSFVSGEARMNEEITCRTSRETFEDIDEEIYRVGSTGASISAGYSISLLHQYCAKLPHDEYFDPKPKFIYFDDFGGTVCHIILPSNAPIHEVFSEPNPSKDVAKKIACLEACKKLHELGALTDYLLPGENDEGEEELIVTHKDGGVDESSRELCEMLIPAALKKPWPTTFQNPIILYFYLLRFNPIPVDRVYQKFGFFLKEPLPREAESMELDLHLAHGRIVKTGLVPLGMTEFDNREIAEAQNFQEMFLKIILDRKEFFSDFVPLGRNDSSLPNSSTFYLLLPLRENQHGDNLTIDWNIIKTCLSSPIFRHDFRRDAIGSSLVSENGSLMLLDGPANESDIVNSLVFTPHNKLFFFVAEILPGMNANSLFPNGRCPKASDYVEHYARKFSIHLLHPEQPLLKAKQLFCLHNLLHDRKKEDKDARELEEHFVEIPPELCSLKIIGFSKDIGSSLSLLPSIMHRLQNMLVAIELKHLFSASFLEGSHVSAGRVLEALTTERCCERFSLERLEVLGDAFLKYAVGRHLFLLYDKLDEGQLTRKRSSIVNNSNLYKLATKRSLHVYIRDQLFDPSQFFTLGRPCKLNCNKDTETTIHNEPESENRVVGTVINHMACSKGHHWLYKKTIADVLESLVGAFIVDSGFKAAMAFLKWMGIHVNFDDSQVSKICIASKSFMSLSDYMDNTAVESSLGYKFLYKGFIVQAFVHPSFNKHTGGCYQRLEFLGDAVLDYLITSYLYSVYPKLKPGQLTDLRSVTVNNNSFAHVAVTRSFQKYLLSDSANLSEAIKKFVNFAQTSISEKNPLDGPTCPKVLGDLVESCVGAILIDTGFDLSHVWRIILTFFDPIMTFSSLYINPARQLRELCQSHNWDLEFSSSIKGPTFIVEMKVTGKKVLSVAHATHLSKKVAMRIAAREIYLDLKARGHRLKKGKSLEEVLKSSTKQQAKLLGFDETPINMVDLDLVRVEHMEIAEVSPAPRLYISKTDPVSKEPASVRTTDFRALDRNPKSPLEPLGKGSSASSEEYSSDMSSDMAGISQNGSAKSRVYEICASNYWNPPLFECCKEEGESHLKLFTFKVTFEIDEPTSTVVECFSKPRRKKKAAAEHAAEGALWYLKCQRSLEG